MNERLDELWDYTEEVAKDDLANHRQPDLTNITPEKVKETITIINDALKKRT